MKGMKDAARRFVLISGRRKRVVWEYLCTIEIDPKWSYDVNILGLE